jgi:large conductance mechanosensitive channel
VLRKAAEPKDDVVIKYGDFIGAVLDFFIVALVLFILVSRIIKAAEGRFGHKDADAAPPAIKECPACCETVPAKATRCKYCTSELKAA